MRILLCCRVLAASLVVAVTARAQTPTVNQQILATRDTVWRAWFANDTARLNRLLPRATTAGEGASQVEWADRKTILEQSREFARNGGKLERLDFANTQVSQSGDVAVVNADYRTVTRNGSRVDTTRGHATEVFVRGANGWMNPFWHLGRSAGGVREIPLPDTLGANFSIADTASAPGSPADYDALLGFWEFRFQTRNSNGSFNPAFPGHWSFEKKPGGMLIEDRWRGDNAQDPMGVGTYTYRTFDPAKKHWEMVGVGSGGGGGAFEHGITWSDANNRYAVQHYGTMIMRIRYLSIEANHFLWRGDQSVDGGKTWLLDAWTMEAKRIGR
jgi:hypothetical protein